jgi:putative ABC transport system permease protein
LPPWWRSPSRGLLILAFIGLFLGMGKAFTATIERSPADIMVLAAKAENLMGGGSGVPAG